MLIRKGIWLRFYSHIMLRSAYQEGCLSVLLDTRSEPKSALRLKEIYHYSWKKYRKIWLLKFIPSDGVDRDSGGELGHGARAGRDTETKCLSQLEPGVLIHLLCLNPPRLLVYYYELLSTGVNWDRQGELGQAEGMGTIPKTNRISLLILERKGVPIRPIWPNSPQLSQSTPMDSTFSREKHTTT